MRNQPKSVKPSKMPLASLSSPNENARTTQFPGIPAEKITELSLLMNGQTVAFDSNWDFIFNLI